MNKPAELEVVDGAEGRQIRWHVWSALTLPIFLVGFGALAGGGMWLSVVLQAEPVIYYGGFYFIALGLFFTYSGLAGLVDRTTITVGGELVRVHCGPLPLGRTTTLPSAEIRSITCIDAKVIVQNVKRAHLKATMSDGSERWIAKWIYPAWGEYMVATLSEAVSLARPHEVVVVGYDGR